MSRKRRTINVEELPERLAKRYTKDQLALVSHIKANSSKTRITIYFNDNNADVYHQQKGRWLKKATISHLRQERQDSLTEVT